MEHKNHPRKTTILLIIASVILVTLVTILLVRLIIQHNSGGDTSQPTQYISGTGTIFTLREDADIPTIDMATADSGAASRYRVAVLNSTTLDVYADCLDAAGQFSPALVANNIDQVLAANGIQDEAARLLFDIEKARVYINHGDTATAEHILSAIDESTLYDSQKGAFYYVSMLYYQAIDDTATADHYSELYSALPWPNWGAS